MKTSKIIVPYPGLPEVPEDWNVNREKILQHVGELLRYYLGIDDELEKIVIYGKNDKGQKYKIEVAYND